MVSYLKAAAMTFVALFAVVLSLNLTTARAEDKKGCELCAESKLVLESIRCEKCKADKQCDKCAAHVKEAEEKLACKADKDGKACADCETALKANKCKFCAAKMYIISHTYCCANCEKAGNEKAAKCVHCTEARAPIEKLECKEKDCPNKKK
jgi:hypothetical protein